MLISNVRLRISKIVWLAWGVFLMNGLCAQSFQPVRTGSLTQLGASLGISTYAVTDEYLSQDRYSGSLETFSLNLHRFKEEKIFRLGIQVASASDLSPNDVPSLSAKVNNFNLKLDQYFRLSKFSLFNRDANLFLGPGYGVNVYSREQNVAVAGRLEDKLVSVFLEFPLRCNFRIESKLTEKLDLSAEWGMNLLAASIRSDLEDDFTINTLTPFQEFRGTLDINFYYHLSQRLSFTAMIHNDLIRVTGWDQRLYSASSGLELGINLVLKKKGDE